jgi:hypothetical protein
MVMLSVLTWVVGACGESTIQPMPSATSATNSPIATLSATATANLTTLGAVSTPTVSKGPVSKGPVPSDWQSRWLKGIPCKVPCWEGITPGKTTTLQAVALLKQSPIIDAASVKIRYSNAIERGVVWEWADATPGQGGELGYYPESDKSVIDYIRPFYPHKKSFLTLGSVMQVYGNPEYVIARFSRGAETTNLFYQLTFYYRQGFIIEASDNGFTSMLELSPNMYVENPEFSAASEDSSNSKLPQGAIAWQGFKDFKFYCRNPDYPDKLCS